MFICFCFLFCFDILVLIFSIFFFNILKGRVTTYGHNPLDHTHTLLYKLWFLVLKEIIIAVSSRSPFADGETFRTKTKSEVLGLFLITYRLKESFKFIPRVSEVFCLHNEKLKSQSFRNFQRFEDDARGLSITIPISMNLSRECQNVIS